MDQNSKNIIIKAICVACRRERRRELESSKKVGDRSSEDSELYENLKGMPLQDVRIWMRYRARAIKGVKDNSRASHADLKCSLCDEEEVETQDHLEGCTGCEVERRGLNMETRKDKLKFWTRMTVKLENRSRGK